MYDILNYKNVSILKLKFWDWNWFQRQNCFYAEGEKKQFLNCHIASTTEGPQLKTAVTRGTTCHPIAVGSPLTKVLCEHNQS